MPATAQDTARQHLPDTTQINHRPKRAPLKLLHAEPLYIDLIRDLGAHKGEHEWNIGLGLTDNFKYDAYTALIEYEWAPINRLGLEVELPFTFYYRTPANRTDPAPGSKLNSLKLAAQYTVLVHPKTQTSAALGYLHEFELPPFNQYSKNNWLEGHLLSPFAIVAKRWGQQIHSLLYAGPLIHHSLNSQGKTTTSAQYNLSLHYMIPGTRNFIGIETNMLQHKYGMDAVLRPQMRVGLMENLMVGIVAGIPLKRESERLSSFLRLIYEPRHRIPQNLDARKSTQKGRRHG